MVLNKRWHLKNKMPKDASVEQRIHWHVTHQKMCTCRGIPDKLKAEMKKRKLI